ncbi:hypothetical protein [Actinokineospora terrae]|uniref:Alpha-1,2-mannosyltransferase n=1 Tax=Actinokineospora terrae TaxID=155974 RepID=A0A1H9RX43_9PSEU|nr:hypothetical protein [Actinokineospora terrae]SER77204.1 alpha-1,2-mannosyltransferase [Actinokineospora terrae]
MFADPARIYADLTSTHNQSLRGLLLRADLPALWPWIASLVCLLTLVAARRCDRLLATTLVGLCAAAISPWSWGHHWVWITPLTVVVADRVLRRRQWAWLVPGVLLVATTPWVLALADPPDAAGPAVLTSGPLWFLVGNLYLVLFVTVLGLALWTGRSVSANPGREPIAGIGLWEDFRDWGSVPTWWEILAAKVAAFCPRGPGDLRDPVPSDQSRAC